MKKAIVVLLVLVLVSSSAAVCLARPRYQDHGSYGKFLEDADRFLLRIFGPRRGRYVSVSAVHAIAFIGTGSAVSGSVAEDMCQ